MTIKQAPQIEFCPVTAFKVYNCYGCAFNLRWGEDTVASCKFLRMKAGDHVVATCYWCHAVIESPDCHNLVHLGGVGEVYACDNYLLQNGKCEEREWKSNANDWKAARSPTGS